MATLYIEEYANIAHDFNGNAIPVPDTLLAAQKVTVAASSAQSSALNIDTKYVILTTDTVCQWEEGSSPTADTNSQFLPANAPRAFKVTGGNKLAVIDQQ